MIDTRTFIQGGPTGNDVRAVLHFINRRKIIRFIRPSFYRSLRIWGKRVTKCSI